MHTHRYKTITYHTKGDTPRVLFLSGLHGDEYESGTIFHEYLTAHANTLPDFVYIPQVSPSAVAAKTRKNSQDHDINREFRSTSTDEEAQAVMHILSQYRADISIDIHEDPDRAKAMYLYDTGTFTDSQLARYRATIHTTGAMLYTGMDDIEDKHLQQHVERGYISLPQEKVIDPGFIAVWLQKKHVIRDRCFTIEIPHKAPRSLKSALIEELVPFLIRECL